MLRDPFFLKIVEGLKARLDPELFERCAVDLLREIYPGLVPIRGGSDAGMDGAIPDGEGVALPLVCTTSKNVIGNLTRNLKSYLDAGNSRRKVVVATSQELGERKRRNLEKAAAKLGFVLTQIHDQAAIAELLYQNPSWCLELLNLPSDPPALSTLPMPGRLTAGLSLVGRDGDLGWLRQSSGDCLLIGQPGCGKTFLLEVFAKEGQALFVSSTDLGRIAAGVRSQKPDVLIVDDAHLQLDLVMQLRHLRSETRANFKIFCSGWPGQKDDLMRAVGVLEDSIHELTLLSRDNIVRIINECGIEGPTGLIHELVNQSDGRPGLAVTLCHVCLKGGIRDIALGDVLCRDVRSSFGVLVGPGATEILAAFALGGHAGMSMSGVGDFLRLSLVDVRSKVTRLAAGGVLTEAEHSCLSVRPKALRHALVRDVFFQGAVSLPLERLIARAPDRRELALTIIGARGRGGRVPFDMLTDLVLKAGSDAVWQEFAWLGASEANWIIDNHPQKLSSIARAALHTTPQRVIPLLIAKAVGDERELHPNPEHPLRLIDDWSKSAVPGSSQPVVRRRILLEAIEQWLQHRNDTRLALRAMKSVLTPAYHSSELSPGSTLSVTSNLGFFTLKELEEIRGFWPRVLRVLRALVAENWVPIQEAIEEWAYPLTMDANLDEGFQETMRGYAADMVKDLTEVGHNRAGVLA